MSKISKQRIFQDSLNNINKPERIICCICQGLLIDPIKCSSCNVHYCTSCIKETSYCLNCTCKVTKSKPDNYLLKILANDVKIFCKNKIEGCPEMYEMELLINHELVCKYNDELCSFCNVIFGMREYETHIMQCIKSRYYDNFSDNINENNILLKGIIDELENRVEITKKENLINLKKINIEYSKIINQMDAKINKIGETVETQAYLINTYLKLNSQNLISENDKDLNSLLENNKECYLIYYCRGSLNCKENSQIWGDNPYTQDSSPCICARHSGLINENYGYFKIVKGSLTQNFSGSNKNGIVSSSYGAYKLMVIEPSKFIIRKDLVNNSKVCGPIFGKCKGVKNGCAEDGNVWGSNPYTGDSNICKCALHSGIINEDGGIFSLESKGFQVKFFGSTNNTVISRSYENYKTSFFVSPFPLLILDV